MAGCISAGRGAIVTIFEKQKKIARKVTATGNGRCNISNANLTLSRYHGDKDFAGKIFKEFGLRETRDFFSSIGLPFIEEKNGKLYPASLQASSVVRMFEYELKKRGIELLLHRRVERVIPQKNGIKIVTAGREEHIFDHVVLSAGSPANSSVGSSGIGYEIAKDLGHRVIEPFPAILPINISKKIFHRLQGVKWDTSVTVCVNGRVVEKSNGELLFTPFGVSGPSALDVSRSVNEAAVHGIHAEICLDFFPDKKLGEVREMIETAFCDSEKPAVLALCGILKERMPEVMMELAGMGDGPCGGISGKKRDRLANIMKNCVMTPGEPRGFAEAVVAAGGIDTSEVDPETMQSKKLKRLYITGEVLDIDGDSGGYNLQFAWSTGAIAGRSAAV
jgi:hypothetical protein